MRILFIITCLTNLAFAFGSLPWMPNPMASLNFRFGGADGLTHPIMYAMLMSIFVSIIAAVFLGVSLLITIYPSWCNIPNRGYWLSEEKLPKTIRRLCSSIELYGIAMMLLILSHQWELSQANQKVPPQLSGDYFLFQLFALPVLAIVEIIWLHISFPCRKTKSDTVKPSNPLLTRRALCAIGKSSCEPLRAMVKWYHLQ